ncbi:MAG: LysM domain-containing protein [Thermoleophilaceae bacterium]
MPSRTSSTSARLLAPLALIACAIALLAVVTASTGDDDGSGGEVSGTASQPTTSPTTAERPQRKQRKFYVVQPGDTLGGIAEKAGVPIATIEQLNPEVDAQALIAGQRIILRE